VVLEFRSFWKEVPFVGWPTTDQRIPFGYELLCLRENLVVFL
jgi:hypothetical protein